MEYTQEQLDKMIADAKAEATKNLFSEEELQRRVTSEVDRRVESGIQKGLETYKSKWEGEFTEKAKLSAEELAKKELEKLQGDLTAKEKEISKRANVLDAKDLLSEAQIPKAHYEKFINVLVNDDGEATKANVENFITVFNETKTDLETKIKSELVNVPSHKTGNGEQVVTKEDFNKMPYMKKMEFKKDNPDKYKDFIGNE